MALASFRFATKDGHRSVAAALGYYLHHKNHRKAVKLCGLLVKEGSLVEVVQKAQVVKPDAPAGAGKPQLTNEGLGKHQKSSRDDDEGSFDAVQAVFEAHMRVNKIPQAIKILQVLTEKVVYVDPSIHEALVRNRILEEDPEGVTKIFSAMASAGLTLNTDLANTIAGALVNKQRYGKALLVFREMANRKLEPDDRSYQILKTIEDALNQPAEADTSS
eukprot:TRINITY_DN561_c0_g2_i1.p1 TRINITY_DN561_c0_g2~~TRINITY_DN561_c0_g2_i1.p1  ORF type:complete len:233 (+),score=63.06 TRINITY_DN561_c0_g2_i1:47-700(+)